MVRRAARVQMEYVQRLGEARPPRAAKAGALPLLRRGRGNWLLQCVWVPAGPLAWLSCQAPHACDVWWCRVVFNTPAVDKYIPTRIYSRGRPHSLRVPAETRAGRINKPSTRVPTRRRGVNRGSYSHKPVPSTAHVGSRQSAHMRHTRLVTVSLSLSCRRDGDAQRAAAHAEAILSVQSGVRLSLIGRMPSHFLVWHLRSLHSSSS